MSISLQITGTERVITKLEQLPARVQMSARSTLDAWAVELAGYIKASKLSGSPLNRRSGRLSGSIHPFDDSTPNSVSAGAAGGAGVKYARIHEYGGDIYPRNAPLLRFMIDGHWISTKHVHMPERSYMRSGLRDEAPRGIEMLRAAVKEALVA